MVGGEFLKEADEWLNPLGYSIMSRSGDNSWANYVKDGDNPSIEVRITEGTKECRVNAGTNMKMLFSISTLWFTFKHPGLQDFLRWGKNYNEAVEDFHQKYQSLK